MAVFASAARKSLFSLLKRVNVDRKPVEIVTRKGDRAYLVAADEYESLVETNYLLSTPANAARLRSALADIRDGHNLVTPSSAELAALADGKAEAGVG